MNGDGYWVERDGQHLSVPDQISWEDAQGLELRRYWEPDYQGHAYYAKGHHPRSFWARYIWLGWRNRASLMSLERGQVTQARPVCISGAVGIDHRTTDQGHYVLQDGDLYQYASVHKWGPFGLSRNVGYKLNHALHGEPVRQVAPVSIGRSLRLRREA